MIATLIAALGAGLLQGFLHCSGMCGPFVLAYSIRLSDENLAIARPWAMIGGHNLGRIMGFALLGMLFGLVGSFVNLASETAGVDGVAGIVGGGLMIAWAIEQLRTGHAGSGLERWSLMNSKPVKAWMRTLKTRASWTSSFLSGLVISIHPCGLLFALLLAAASSGSWWHGGLVLVLFGVGTVPAMVSVALAGFYGRKRLSGRWANYAMATLIGLSGMLFALRGLAINGLVPAVNPWLF